MADDRFACWRPASMRVTSAETDTPSWVAIFLEHRPKGRFQTETRLMLRNKHGPLRFLIRKFRTVNHRFALPTGFLFAFPSAFPAFASAASRISRNLAILARSAFC